MTTPAADAGADLKTYDVPDPPRAPGWKLRCLLAAGLGLALAAGFIVAVRLPHLMWVVVNHGGYVSGWAMDRVERDYEPEALRPYVLAIADPVTRGRFHKVLAGSGDPAQLDAMFAYLLDVQSDFEVVDSMLALDKARAAARLVGTCEELAEGDRRLFASMLTDVVVDKFPPAELAPHVVKIADLARRGRYHAALATTKDAAHIDAVLAYAGSVVPTDPGSSRPAEWGPLVASLAAFGQVATPRLQKELEHTESRSLVSLAAEALRSSDLPFLVKRARELLDHYDEGVPQLARDAQLVNLIDEGQDLPEGISAEDVTASRQRLEAASRQAYMIFEVLRALEQVKGDQSVDFCIVRGLSAFDREIAEWSALRIKERFTPDQLVDTLFSYIAQKNEFKMVEVDLYEGLIKELGQPGAARVATNLERLLGEKEGDPERVFWLYKKMGFTLLRELGQADALPVLKKYAADPGSYVLTTTSTDSSGNRTRREEEKNYADEVRAAIEAIEARGGEGPQPPPEEPPPEDLGGGEGD